MFENRDNIIISIGDSEIIKFENISSFNPNVTNSKYEYTRVKNYKTEEEHIINCENCICFLTPTNYFMLNGIFDELNSPINIRQMSYKNKILKNLDIIEGSINMYNFFVPFDFDGDRFLFLDYQTKDIRRICIYFTLSKSEPYIHIIKEDFGHISFMKLLDNDKVFICRKDVICEIYQFTEELILLDNWNHIGEEIISVDVYFSGGKISSNEIFNNRNTRS